MDNNETDEISESNTGCRETHEKEMPSTYHETCENDEVEVTALGNIVDYDVSNNNDSESSDGRSNHDVTRTPSIGFADYRDMCLICEKKIYPMEKLTTDGKLYHKNCFRCVKCRTILSVSNFTLNNNAIYCKTHFMELFKIRGKFDDHGDIQNEIITGNESETIPTVDTKGLLAKFREMETGSGITLQAQFSNRSNSNSTQRYVHVTDDIVRSEDLAPDELPPPETAKAMVAKFKAMEVNENVPSPKCVEKMQQKAKAMSTPNSNVRLHTAHAQASVNEEEYNNPVELPEEGATKNLLSKFQGLSEIN